MMPVWRRIHFDFAALAIGVFVVLLASPRAGWIMRHQAAHLFQEDDRYLHEHVMRTASATATSYPSDYQVQLAAAIWSVPESRDLPGDYNFQNECQQRFERVRELVNRFPNEPSLYAHLLVFQATAQFDFMTEIASSRPPVGDMVRPAPEQLAEFERYAEAGERLDSGNAYFPLLHSAGLFAAHHDDEAIRALHRAAGKPRWNAYSRDDALGLQRLRVLSGPISALQRPNGRDYILHIRCLGIADFSHAAVTCAMEAEGIGDYERGWSIRKDLLRCFDKIRSHDPEVFADWREILVSATTLPGYERDAIGVKRQRRFVDYLRSIKHDRDADPASAVFAVDHLCYDRITVIDGTKDKWDFGRDDKPLNTLRIWWLSGALALGNCLWLSVIAALAFLVEGCRRARHERPLSAHAREAVWCALGLGCAWLLWEARLRDYFRHDEPRFRIGITELPLNAAVVFACLFLLVFIPLAWRAYQRKALHHVGLMLAVLAASVAAGTLISAEARTVIEYNTPLDGRHPLLLGNRLDVPASAASCLALPLLLLIGAIVFSAVRRVPLSHGAPRFLARTALPLTCATFAAYGVVVLGTARLEPTANHAMAQTVSHDGEYYARLVGKKWPGPVHWQ
jgi:hypothetical protein